MALRPSIFFNIVLKLLTNSGSQETEMRCLKTRKSRCKKSLFAGNIDYIVGAQYQLKNFHMLLNTVRWLHKKLYREI